MFIEFCKSKIGHGHITEAQLHYEGSITVDEAVLKAADIIPGEKVEVLNMNNGNRFTTYAIAGKTGEICLNGPAARLGLVGDQVVILSYAIMDPKEAKTAKTKIVYLDQNNKIKKK
ncbi:MAG TPA: aspartate 1-decarboxylase [Candidatus Omnitrophota bacterium]|nr:aspartate 1-decarboxylase [Candidatus Omnitrophota bacterium]